MAGHCSTFTCRLYRDGLQTPWGFRLQGGKDFNQPLTVQRVFTGSPAEGELQRGDIIIKINNTDVNCLNHKQAQDIIKTPAGQLVLDIQRGQTRYTPVKGLQPAPAPLQQSAPSGFRPVPFESSPGPKPYAQSTGGMNFAVDYTGRVGSPTRRPQQTMINRVHDSLNEAIYAHQSGNDPENDYDYGTVTDRKKLFCQDTPETKYFIHVKPNVSQGQRHGAGVNDARGQSKCSKNPRFEVDANRSHGKPNDHNQLKQNVPQEHQHDHRDHSNAKMSHGQGENSYGQQGMSYGQPDMGYGRQEMALGQPEMAHSHQEMSYGRPETTQGHQEIPEGHGYLFDNQYGDPNTAHQQYDAYDDGYNQQANTSYENQYENDQAHVASGHHGQETDHYEPVPVKDIAQHFDHSDHAQTKTRYGEHHVKPTASHHYRFDDNQAQGPFEYHPVKDNVKFYQGPKHKYGTPVVHSPGRPSKTGKGWRPPQQISHERPMEFGWTPSKGVQPGYRAGPPTQERAYSPPRPAPAPVKSRQVTTHIPSGDGAHPAWKGTLHGAGAERAPALQAPAPRSVTFSANKPNTMPHQNPNNHPSPVQQHHQPHASQHQPQPQHDGQHGGPKVVHLQYNSPMGLYSKQNVDETYAGQTQALQSGHGGDGKDNDYTKSYAWQMIKQEQTPGGGSKTQTTTESQYHEKQSRSFTALENAVGASDF